MPASVHVFCTDQRPDSAPFRAYYVSAELRNKRLLFDSDTTLNRRLTPSQFFERNEAPVLVVNGTFFSFETNRSLNAVAKNGKLLSHNQVSYRGRGKDSVNKYYSFKSAIGITKKRKADVAWLFTGYDSSFLLTRRALAYQYPVLPMTLPDLNPFYTVNIASLDTTDERGRAVYFSKRFDTTAFPVPQVKEAMHLTWEVETAIGGGPVLVQDARAMITNEEENAFVGKAINDKHPRTAMGYTKDGKLIILAVEGRNAQAGGATLNQLAQIMIDLGCTEALNLDGGGSTCLLVNGKETVKPSDKTGQRPVPAVFLIKQKK